MKELTRINKDGLFYLQYTYQKLITDPYPILVNEYFTELESMRNRKVALANNPFESPKINFLGEGTAIVKDGMIIPENEKITVHCR